MSTTGKLSTGHIDPTGSGGSSVHGPAGGKPRLRRHRLAESPQITPIAGVVGMRLRSVVLESLWRSKARTKAVTLVGHC